MQDRKDAAAAAAVSEADGANPGKRRRAMVGAIAAFAVLGTVYGGYSYWESLHYAYTDDAYVHADLVQVTPQVGGTVVAVDADDTQRVKAGQPLVELDDADTRVALQRSEAALAQAVRRVRVVLADDGSLAALVAVRATEVDGARATLARAEDTLHRRLALAASGAVGAEELRRAQLAVQSAQAGLRSAQAAVEVARRQWAANRALTAGTVVADNPPVRLAAAEVRQAYLAYERTVVPAPVDGVVARRSVQLGQRVAAGTPLMWVVPLQHVWVDANLKETQLADVRIGQPATVTADTYGGRVQYQGHVFGLGAGSGSAFALLPAQDATGNWIKVVQRIPVRIALDPAQLERHPLRVGMSTEVTIDIRRHGGRPILGELAIRPAARTRVYATHWKQADELVRSIVVANAGIER